MMFEIHRARFLQATVWLQELVALHQVKSGSQLSRGPMANSELTDAILLGHVERLLKGGLIERTVEGGETSLGLNTAGEQQLRILMVDYMRELMLLHGEMIEIFRRKLVEFYLDGVRRVAFYPIGDTAEVVYLALQASGLSLKAAVDDDPLLWGAKFHELVVAQPSSLVGTDIDGIIMTTSVFEAAIRQRVEVMGNQKVRLLSLW
jgi:hypothetical protein